MLKFIKSHWVIISLLALAGFFRFWQISRLPGGLFPDEAANGLDVNSILDGDAQPFYERGNGREALFFYALAAVVRLFGRGPWQHHVVSAAFGFLAVWAAYLLARRLFSERIACLTAFFMGVSSYAVTVSRTAFRANTVPLLATLTLLFLVKAMQTANKRARAWSAAAAGLCFALGFYTYTSFRMMLPLLVGFGLVLLFAHRRDLYKIAKKYKDADLAFCGAFAAGIAWLIYYFVQHPASVFGRAGQVSIFSPDLNQGDVLATFLEVLRATVLSFFTQGDLNWRHNVSGFPFLSPFVSPFFAVALIVFTIAMFRILGQTWKGRLDKTTVSMSLVGLWFWLMLVPEVTTAEGIPHGLRLIGIMPAMFIMPAWAVSWVWDRLRAMDWLYNFKYVLAIIFFSSIFFYNYFLYFGLAAASPEYYYAFRSDLTEVSRYLNERNDPARTFLSLDAFSVQTVEYLTTETNTPYILLDPASTYEVKLVRGDQIVFTQSSLFDRLKFMKAYPRAEIVTTEKNQFGEVIMLVYEQL